MYQESIREIKAGLNGLFVPPKTFTDAGEEAAFILQHSRGHLWQRRVFLVIAPLIWLAYAYWDFHHWIYHRDVYTGDIFTCVLILRGVGLCGILFTTRMSFHPLFLEERYASLCISSGVVMSVIMLMAMMSILPAPLNYEYYFVGIILVLFFQYGAMALLATYSLVVTLISVLLLALQEWLHGPLGVYFFPAMFYLMSFATLGWTVSVRFERGARERFLQTGRLNDRNARLQEANADALRQKRKADQAYRELFDKELEKARQLDAKTQATARFVRAAYHDTLQPLASIANLALAGTKALEAGQAQCLMPLFDDIAASGREINLLFSGLRDVFAAADRPPDIGTVWLNEVLDELAAVFNALAVHKGLVLRVRRRTPDVPLHTDAVMVRRVLGNLISNAIKYTEQGGVLVGGVVGKRMVRIDVVDTGIGIPVQSQRSIFEEFFQLDNPRRDAAKGLGLGLYIVKTFIELLPGHRVSFSSVEGRGTRFSVDCPLAAPATPGDEGQAVRATAADIDLAGTYVLLVDDDVRLLDSLAATLSAFGAIVRTAADLQGLEALLLNAPDRQPDLLICDWQLADAVDATHVIARVRDCFAWARVPVLVYSANAAGSRFTPQPLLAWVSKAQPPEQLLAAVQALLLAGRAANEPGPPAQSTPST